jgi:hypothetical protein
LLLAIINFKNVPLLVPSLLTISPLVATKSFGILIVPIVVPRYVRVYTFKTFPEPALSVTETVATVPISAPISCKAASTVPPV